MKRLTLSLLCSIAMCTVGKAQLPEKKNISLVHKITATWCGPCGGWGWVLADDLIKESRGKALYVSLFTSKDSSNGNYEFYNNTAYDVSRPFFKGSYPDFGVNGIAHEDLNRPAIFVDEMLANIMMEVDSFAATEPLASAASELVIDGNDLTVNAKVQFWLATEGEYYLAAYLIEDGALNLQSGRGKAKVAHHGVLRASMANAAWGEKIAEGSIATDATFDKTFEFTVTDPKWDPKKFKIYNVIWKKVQNKYLFINASVQSKITGLDTTLSVNSMLTEQRVSLFPVPARESIQLGIESDKATQMRYNVTNLMGQQCLPDQTIRLAPGNNREWIVTSSLASGIYFLNIRTEEGYLQKKFVIH